jgi:hypothetical protein
MVARKRVESQSRAAPHVRVFEVVDECNPPPIVKDPCYMDAYHLTIVYGGKEGR